MNNVIIDVRDQDEFDVGHAKGAINIPVGYFLLDELPEDLRYLPKDQPLIVYCQSGRRAETCKSILLSQGFTDVTNGVNQAGIKKDV